LCGRFTLKVPVAEWLRSLFPGVDISARFGWTTDTNSPRYNIAPTQNILTLHYDSTGALRINPMRWGLIPFWADSAKSAYSMLNARSETLLEKASFKSLVSAHRCVILADGYYEWKAITPKNKQPFWIHRPNDEPFAMAGLWTTNRKAETGKEIVSTTIITMPSNDDTRDVHDRMPAILRCEHDIMDWLAVDASSPDDRIAKITQPLESGTLSLRPVSKEVNSVKSDNATLIEPIKQP
jgi:putative SOS response-associated peptidase YedK